MDEGNFALGSVSGDLEAYTSHSLKATALSWSAKSGTMSYEERLTPGHHVHPKLGMALLYSRDAMAEIMVKVRRVVRAIASGAFSPDLPRAQRVVLALQKAPEDFAHLPETQPDLWTAMMRRMNQRVRARIFLTLIFLKACRL